MWTRKAETLSTLQIVMNHPRASGKTWAMINGIANSESGGVVVVVNQDHARWLKNEIRNPKVKFVSLEELDKLRGNTLPVVLDHFTVSHVLSYAFEMLKELQEENNILKSELHAWKEHDKPQQTAKNNKTSKAIRNATYRR